MLTFVRAGLAAAFLAIVCLPASAQSDKTKAFQRGELDEAAIKLTEQIRTDAGTVTRNAATLRKDADTAFQKNDHRTGMTVLGQLVTVAPDEAGNWLRLARAIRGIRPLPRMGSGRSRKNRQGWP